MARIRSKDTAPERGVRSTVRRLGFRFRLRRGGQPDLVLPRLRKVILVHGCFWHRHRCATGRTMPKSRADYWCAKFERNRTRDARAKFPGQTLADLYDPLAMPKPLRDAHRALDRAVDRCYRRAPFDTERARVEYLFELYQKLTAPLTAKPAPKRRRKPGTRG